MHVKWAICDQAELCLHYLLLINCCLFSFCYSVCDTSLTKDTVHQPRELPLKPGNFIFFQ